MIPEIHIWRVANLMIKPYGDTSEVESASRVDELGHAGDTAGVAVWCPIIDAVDQLANTTPPGLVHLDVIECTGKGSLGLVPDQIGYLSKGCTGAPQLLPRYLHAPVC
jgi:hypothetical protein